MADKKNLELKHFYRDEAKLNDALTALGAQRYTAKTQKDIFFNVPADKEAATGRLKLRIEKDRQFIIYYERPAFGAPAGTASDIKLYDVTDPQLVPFLVASLGVKAEVDKYRVVWRKGHTVFHLDSIVGVGNIFEIEVQCDGEPTAEDHRLFNEYRAALLPLLGPVCDGSNVDLLLARRAKMGA